MIKSNSNIPVMLLFLGLLSCQQESIQTKIQSNCVNRRELIVSRDTGFFVWHPGSLENGFAEAIKINKEWNASAFASYQEAKINIGFLTYFEFNEKLYDEEIISLTFYYSESNNCYELKNNLSSNPTNTEAKAYYVSVNYDVLRDSYRVDEEGGDNYLEIEKVDLDIGKISGRFMVTFLRNSEYTPHTFNLPRVRFFSGYFEADINFFLEND